jgi:hypothetical protein
MRTQNPPPLKACRFDSDLGHHTNSRTTCARRRLQVRLTRRSGLLSANYRFSPAKPRNSVAQSLHTSRPRMHWHLASLNSNPNWTPLDSVIKGRRRIGKSRLTDEFARQLPRYKSLHFQGLPPTAKLTAEQEREDFAQQSSINQGTRRLQVTTKSTSRFPLSSRSSRSRSEVGAETCQRFTNR